MTFAETAPTQTIKARPIITKKIRAELVDEQESISLSLIKQGQTLQQTNEKIRDQQQCEPLGNISQGSSLDLSPSGSEYHTLRRLLNDTHLADLMVPFLEIGLVDTKGINL